MRMRKTVYASLLALVGACGEDLPLSPAQPAHTPAIGSSAQALTAPTCVTLRRGALGSVSDATIKKNALTKNFGSQSSLRVSDKEEALLRFDLGRIPASASVTKATLKLYVNGEAGDGTIEVHRARASWNESTVTFATFGQRFDRDALALFRVPSKNALKSIDVGPQVERWLAGEPNHGLLLAAGLDHHPRCRHQEDEDEDPTLFVSSDATSASKRPALEICYTARADSCSTHPCANGGACTNAGDTYTCSCAPGFSGPTCATNMDDCAAAPCRNGGFCTDRTSGYTCACPEGFAGLHCETNLDDCAAAPCRNGGVCNDGVAAFTCTCAPGFEGTTCERDIDDCTSSPCHNAGSCIDTTNGYICACSQGYMGTTCDLNIDDCTPGACQNGGTCVDGVAGYTCSCLPDFGGAQCELNLNSCAQQPCLNGGACRNTGTGYVCACSPGYAGTNCEIDLDDCADQPCLNDGQCIDGVASYTCACPPEFTGPNCELDVCATDGNDCTGDLEGASGICQAGACCNELDDSSVALLGSELAAVAVGPGLESALDLRLGASNPLKPLSCDLQSCSSLGCVCLFRSGVTFVSSEVGGPTTTSLGPEPAGAGLLLTATVRDVRLNLRQQGMTALGAFDRTGVVTYSSVTVNAIFDLVPDPSGSHLTLRPGSATTDLGPIEMSGFETSVGLVADLLVALANGGPLAIITGATSKDLILDADGPILAAPRMCAP